MNFFTKTKFLVAIIIVLSAIILAIFGTIGFHYFRYERLSNDRPQENNQGAKYMAKQLELNSDQTAQLETLRDRFHKESSTLMSNSRNISTDIMNEITAENPDMVKLKDLAEKFGKVQEEQKLMMINHLLEVKGKCNCSQKMQFKKFIRKMEKHEQMNRQRNRNSERRQRN